MTRLDKILRAVRREDKILEIGASYNPAAPKRKGWNTRVLDHCTKAELVAKYEAIHLGTRYNALTFELSRIEEVDYVWHGGPLECAIPTSEHGTFDACVASHVIEHTPDLVGFIKSIEILLKPGGLICLAVPDKRYCFDYFHPVSSIGNVIDAIGNSRHSRGKVFDSSASGILQNKKATWGPGILRNFELGQKFEDSYDLIRNYHGRPDEPYLDCHGWFFTPHSFQLIIVELARLGLIGSHIHSTLPTTANEFFVNLQPGPTPLLSDEDYNRQRLDLLTATQVDLLEQAYYNPSIRLSFRWKARSQFHRFLAELADLADSSFLLPVYQAYKHYYRDRPTSPARFAGKGFPWKNVYDSARGAASHIVRSYHYQLTIGTKVASRWRRRASTAADSVPHRVLKPLASTPADSVLFVTYHPTGRISDHVRHYALQFKRVGFSVLLVKVVDELNHPSSDAIIPEVDAAMVRQNAGFDFGAWAHGLQTFPEVYHGKTLWMVNDSVFGPVNPAAFDRLLERIVSSRADLVGLTESRQYHHHFQSYFLAFLNLPRRADAIRSYWSNVRNIPGKVDVIFEYELNLLSHFSRLGFDCRTLYPTPEISLDLNPTHYAWKQLLLDGYPFIKVPLLKPGMKEVDNSTCRDVFSGLGYDRRMIDQHFETMRLR